MNADPRTLLLIAILTFIAIPCTHAFAQKSAEEGTSTFYIPGMPAPPATSKATPEGKASARKGGKISSITMVDRSTSKGTTEADSRKQDVPVEIYGGIIPGARDSQSKKGKTTPTSTKSRNRLTWLGFQPGDKGSAIFLQTRQIANYKVQTLEGGEIVEVTLKNTRTHRRNERRTLDTRFWPTAAISVQAKQRRRDVVITIKLQRAVEYKVRQDSDYLYIEFQDAGIQPAAAMGGL